MRALLTTTCLTAIALTASPAAAEQVITTATTTPVLTGTIADDLRISSTGSIKPVGGAAVTINSNHNVKNEGTIAIIDASNATGILANPGFTSNITNSGTITIDENYTPTDSDSDGDLDGLFATGANRFGIRVLGGGTFTGTILNSGTITVEGNNSGGIAVDSALTGSLLTNGGAISVTGNDSVGIRAGNVSGNVTLFNGTVNVKGANSVGVALDGNIGGALLFQNQVTATGYRNVTPPVDVSKYDADDLLQGGGAVRIAGNVAGGIVFEAKPTDLSTTDTDEDDDGIADATETDAVMISYGSAPAVTIGSTSQDIAIGAVASSAAGHGLVMKGGLNGLGVYKGVSATGLSIGGTGHNTTIAGGITLQGGVLARSVEANAVAVRIGAGATVPEIQVNGGIIAEGGGTAATSARGFQIDAGATVNALRIASGGSISVTRGGTEGTLAAIFDASGTLGLIENSGSITANGVATLGDKAVAFDLGANTTGATYHQLLVAAPKPAPRIFGEMRFGSGNDILDIDDGTVTGAAKFGIGNNQLLLSGDSVMNGAVTFGAGGDRVDLSGTSALTGNIDFGGGADILTLAGTSVYSGSLSNSGGVAASVGAGTTLDLTNQGSVALASLTTGSGSKIGVTINSEANTHTLYNVAGAADFGASTTVAVRLASLGGADGTYTILNAGSLTGANNLVSSVGLLPFLYDSSLNTSVPNQVSLVVRLKTAAELGLNSSEGSILGGVLGAADSDDGVANVFLGIQDGATLRATLQQMLPEHAGGAFENSTKGSRLANRMLADPKGSPSAKPGIGLWIEQVAWGSSKSIGDTSSYKLGGWGASGGIERGLGDAVAVGLMLGYFTGKDKKDSQDLISNQFEGGAYWRGAFGPLKAYAKAGIGRVAFDGTRFFTGTADGVAVTRTAEGDWNGTLASASAGLSYEARMGRLTLRPAAAVDHFSLKEKAYDEEGGGTAFNLSVDSRTSSETAANLTLALGYDLLSLEPDASWMRVELEAGRRQLVGGKLGSTTARFTNGVPFTLDAEQRESSWLGGLRLLGGGPGTALAGEVTVEDQQGQAAVGGRVSLHFGM